ncbi:MAG: DegT/DnrJ/EryC1/StrS family aminotransferase [Acidobacteria bacterium]|nr:DegT/DnrJ/EryC1/StrS family aminotransferase [Acidobacteriota bacterium]
MHRADTVNELTIPAVNLKLQYETIREEVEAAVRRVFDRQDFILGAEVAELEREMARRHDCSHAIGCASGSDALLLSLMALGIGPGDAVLVPAFTFFSTAGSVALLGARPVFTDIDLRTFNLSSATVEQALHENRSSRLKAIIPVHLYGQCAEMDGLMALAAKNSFAVIEDAAQAVLARYRGRAAGSIGQAGCFSFYPTKNLSAAGDGGMITTNDATLAERLRLLRNHGSTDKRFFPALGMNSRLDTLQAAVLLIKLRHLEDWTRLRKQKAEFYRQSFAKAGLVANRERYPSKEAPIVLPYEAKEAEHVYHQFTVRASDRDKLCAHLEAKGIGTAVYYPVPLHRQPAFATLRPVAQCPEADRAAAEVLSLPLYPELTEAQQAFVVDQVRTFYRP